MSKKRSREDAATNGSEGVVSSADMALHDNPCNAPVGPRQDQIYFKEDGVWKHYGGWVHHPRIYDFRCGASKKDAKPPHVSDFEGGFVLLATKFGKVHRRLSELEDAAALKHLLPPDGKNHNGSGQHHNEYEATATVRDCLDRIIDEGNLQLQPMHPKPDKAKKPDKYPDAGDPSRRAIPDRNDKFTYKTGGEQFTDDQLQASPDTRVAGVDRIAGHQAPVKVFSYKLTLDNNTAPCIEDGLLSLALCKKNIRLTPGRNKRKKRKPLDAANEGDYVLGFSSIVATTTHKKHLSKEFMAKGKGREDLHLLYAFKVSKVWPFEYYQQWRAGATSTLPEDE